MPDKIDAILIGAGSWGRSWVRILQQQKNWNLVAVVDQNPDAVAAVMATAGLPVEKGFIDHRRALKNIEADVVLVATPPATHRVICQESLEKGFHVIVEKPAANEVSDAIVLRKAAEKAGRQIMVAQNYRSFPVARKIRREMAEKKFGQIGSIYCEYQMDLAGSESNSYRAGTPFGLIYEMCVHHLDLVRYWLGESPIKVYATGWNSPWSWSVEPSSVAVHMEFLDNIKFIYNATWAGRIERTPWFGRWRFLAEIGEVFCDDSALVVTNVDGESDEIFTDDSPADLTRIKVLEEFSAAIESGRETETSITDNLETMLMCAAVEQSIKEGRPVDMDSLRKKFAL